MRATIRKGSGRVQGSGFGVSRSRSHSPLTTALWLVSFTVMLSASAMAQDIEALEQKAMQAAVARVAPSVVRIETIGGREKVEDVLVGTGPTTGLVVGADGYIVSSAFNFLQEPASILVQTPEGTRKPARLVATDHNRMVVLLKIEPDKPLAVPEFAPQDETRVGQWAIAVGGAFESDRPSMAVGVVSALDRVWGKAIQTDAAVSPNNYGGPLVDICGRVLGMLLPLSPEAAGEAAGWEWYDSGIGFAVPGHQIQAVMERLKKGKDLWPGVIGISFSEKNLATAEPVIAACRPNSPAYEAGVRAKDRIVQIGDRQVRRAAEVKEELSRRYAGDQVRLVVLRAQQRIERELTLVEKLDPSR